MTHYSRTWDCRICGKHQESMSYPSVYVCESCIRPLASKLCYELFKVPLGPGIDESHFMNKAYGYALALLGKGQSSQRKQAP